MPVKGAEGNYIFVIVARHSLIPYLLGNHTDRTSASTNEKLFRRFGSSSLHSPLIW